MSIFGYTIPHAKVSPVRDMLKVQMPYPPKKIGSILTPDIWRDLSQHTHQMGVIRGMGPLSFAYEAFDGKAVHKITDEDGTEYEVSVGDWVMFKWGAGTSFQAQKGVVSGGWRYLSSFGDAIGVVLAKDMPDLSTFTWEEDDEEINQTLKAAGISPAQTVSADHFNFDNSRGVVLNPDGLGAPSIIGASGGSSHGSGHGRKS